VTLTPHLPLVPWSRKSRAIPLLPLWAVQPVQSLSACTKVTFIFFFFTLTSNQQTLINLIFFKKNISGGKKVGSLTPEPEIKQEIWL
jgi:hypothetical protein